MVLSEGQSSVVLGLLGFKMESETIFFDTSQLGWFIDLWNWNVSVKDLLIFAPWGYGAFGIPYGKKIEDTDENGCPGFVQVEFAPLRMILVESYLLY